MKVRLVYELDADELAMVKAFYKMDRRPTQEEAALFLESRIRDVFEGRIFDNDLANAIDRVVDERQMDCFPEMTS